MILRSVPKSAFQFRRGCRGLCLPWSLSAVKRCLVRVEVQRRWEERGRPFVNVSRALTGRASAAVSQAGGAGDSRALPCPQPTRGGVRGGLHSPSEVCPLRSSPALPSPGHPRCPCRGMAGRAINNATGMRSLARLPLLVAVRSESSPARSGPCAALGAPAGPCPGHSSPSRPRARLCSAWGAVLPSPSSFVDCFVPLRSHVRRLLREALPGHPV